MIIIWIMIAGLSIDSYLLHLMRSGGKMPPRQPPGWRRYKLISIGQYGTSMQLLGLLQLAAIQSQYLICPVTGLYRHTLHHFIA
jgi:hypothetical protein